jgi:carboxymethylenebutenolidase
MNVSLSSVELGEKLRAQLFAPVGPSRRWPAIVAYSDIFQQTLPHVRLCTRLASYGFRVVSPELYGRIEPLGTVLRFEEDRQRALDDSSKMDPRWLDEDVGTAVAYAARETDCVLACGWCIGGHLAFRAALKTEVKATVCFYATGLHNDALGSGTIGSLGEASRIKGELMLVWGARDPHIPAEGRAKVHRGLADAGVAFQVRNFDAEHAFMRDEGLRWQPAAADDAFRELLSVFNFLER